MSQRDSRDRTVLQPTPAAAIDVSELLFYVNKCHETTIKNLKFQLSSHERSLYYISFLNPLMQIGLEGWIKQ